jgi:ADP-ribose pyrophosphatase YjhB (NUDIX family)
MKAMIIDDTMHYMGTDYRLHYEDADSFDDLPRELCRQAYGVCFYNDQMVIGFGGHKQGWGLIGGTVEPGETYEQTLAREVAEESNMRVLASRPIGYQRVTNPDSSVIYQLRYVAKVEPIGPFKADPAGSVTEIKLIDPGDYKQYFDWGQIGERLVARALELKAKL